MAKIEFADREASRIALEEKTRKYYEEKNKPKVAKYFLFLHRSGTTSPGCTWDREVTHPGGVECTKEQYDNHNDYEVVGKAIVKRPQAEIDARNSEWNARTNKFTADGLMAAAGLAIAPLSDAVEIGVATDEEKSSLVTWKKYRILLHRVDLTAQNPAWPVVPK